jgi:hypothetical protein
MRKAPAFLSGAFSRSGIQPVADLNVSERDSAKSVFAYLEVEPRERVRRVPPSGRLLSTGR